MGNRYNRLKKILLTLPEIAARRGEAESYCVLTRELAALSQARVRFSPEQDQAERRAFQETLLPLIQESPFCKHVFDKPFGYAGDFQTQEMIWFAHETGDGYRYIGDTERGRLLSSLTFQMENAKANVERMHLIKRLVAASGKRIASIGCGSCIELWGLGKKALKGKEILLLDQDARALQRARKKLDGRGAARIDYIGQNILKFIAINKSQNLLGDRDFIYSIGMLDYFTVKSAKKIVRALWENVAPGGRLLCSNAHPANPTRLWMEYGGEWFLSYKDKDEMLSIAADLENVQAVNYRLDQYNVYHYLEVTKNDRHTEIPDV